MQRLSKCQTNKMFLKVWLVNYIIIENNNDAIEIDSLCPSTRTKIGKRNGQHREQISRF